MAAALAGRGFAVQSGTAQDPPESGLRAAGDRGNLCMSLQKKGRPMSMIVAALLIAYAGQDPTPPEANPDMKVICRTVAMTGSRVRSERICKTAAEWTAYRQEARRHVEQMQTNRGTAVLDNDRQNAGKGGI